MNIIYDGKSLTNTKFSSEKTYNVDDINFYINKYNINNIFYIVIKDETNKIESIKLRILNNSNGMYILYGVSYNWIVNLKPGNCRIEMLEISSDTLEVVSSSNYININLDFSNYNSKSEITLIEKASNEISRMLKKCLDAYEKIVSLTNLNIDIAKEVKNE